MIHASIRRRADGSIRMTLRGHARAAPRGEDLVCASASMLAYTAAQAVLELREMGELSRRPRISLRPGAAEIIATPKKGREETLRHTFWVIHCGLEALAGNYPKCMILE